MTKPKEQTSVWPIGKLQGWDRNPRVATPQGIERLKRQIIKHGLYKPLIVNTNPDVAPVGAVAGGNMRLKAMQELDIKQVWVIPKHFKDEREMVEISLSDNDRVGRYLEDGLVSLVSGLEIDLGDYSVDLKEPPNLDVIVKNYGASAPGDDDAPALPEKPRSKAGDLFELGEHRVLCGNSTSEDDFKKLMNGELAQVCNTDPPYNIDYQSKAKSRKTKAGIENDNLTDPKYLDLISKALALISKYSADSMSIYWWFASRNIESNLQALRGAGFYPAQWIIWLKNSLALSTQDYHHCFEPCLMGWKKGEVHFKNKNILNLKDVFSQFKNDDEALKAWLSQVFVEEFDVWFQHRDNTKEYLHPCLRPGSLVETWDSWKPIEQINQGDMVLSADGEYHSVVEVSSHECEGLYRIEVGGEIVEATGNHPFLIKRKDEVAWIEARLIQKGDQSLTVANTSATMKPWGRRAHQANTQVETDIQPKKDITGSMPTVDIECRTTLSGNENMGPSQGDIRFTTGTATGRTIQLPTSSLSIPLHISGYTLVAYWKEVNGISHAKCVGRENQPQQSSGTFPGGGSQDVSVESALSERPLMIAEFELRTVGSVKSIAYQGPVINLQVEGIPAFQTKIGMSHNTQKPVALAERAIKKNSKPGDIVVDAFGGSGSTLIAAQKLSRRARVMELDPAYVDVIVSRYCTFTSSTQVIKNGKKVAW